MANRIEPFSVTTPAGTTEASFQTSALTFDRGHVSRLEILVPPGPSGLLGFRVAHSGQSVIPYKGSEWLITDDEKLDWDLDDFPYGGMWQLHSYNTDVYDHTIYLRFHVHDQEESVPPIVAPLAIYATASAEDSGDLPDSGL